LNEAEIRAASRCKVDDTCRVVPCLGCQFSAFFPLPSLANILMVQNQTSAFKNSCLY